MNGCRKCTKHYHQFVKSLKTINYESQAFKMVWDKAIDKNMNLSGCSKCSLYPLRSAYENHVRYSIYYDWNKEYNEAMDWAIDELEELKSNGLNIIKLLIKNGANVFQTDQNGRNIFDIYLNMNYRPMSQEFWQLMQNYSDSVKLEKHIKCELTGPPPTLLF